MPAGPVPAAVAFAPVGTQPSTAAPPGSLSTVSKNDTSSADVRTARTPVPSIPHASMIARRVRHQPPGLGAAASRPPRHCAESRSTHRSSPLPGRSARSRERSEKYSRSRGRNPSPARRSGSGNRSSGSGHAAACAGSARAAVTRAANCARRKPQRSPTEANGRRSRQRSRVISYGSPVRSRAATAMTLSTEPSTQCSCPITER